MKLKAKMAKKYYDSALNEKDMDVKFCLLWRALFLLSEDNKSLGKGARQGLREYIETEYEAFDSNVDFEDERLDVFYERPFFSDGRVEEDRDIYFYQDFNTNRQYRSDDDYVLSIRSFQKILEESDLVSLYMTIFKIYDYIIVKENDNYSERDKRLLEGSAYLLECALNNLMLN